MTKRFDCLFVFADGFYIIDFQQNIDLANEMEKFIENEVKMFCDKKARLLLDLLYHPSVEFNLFAQKEGPPFLSYRQVSASVA